MCWSPLEHALPLALPLFVVFDSCYVISFRRPLVLPALAVFQYYKAVINQILLPR